MLNNRRTRSSLSQPLEAVRIRLVSNPAFASGLAGGFGRILKEEGIGGFYAGFGPILFKQVPYTMAKFAVYEVAFEKICTAAGKKPTELTEGTKTAFNLTAGLIAGLAAAFISQPADTLLSRMNKTAGRPGQGMVSRIMEVRRLRRLLSALALKRQSANPHVACLSSSRRSSASRASSVAWVPVSS